MAKRYPLEFRNDVVAVARRRADSLSSIARDFGISEATLYNWLKRADINEGVRDGMTSAEAEQIRELKRRNKVLEQEVEILRRAATCALLASAVTARAPHATTTRARAPAAPTRVLTASAWTAPA